ncbi:MAG: protein-methionine-sulfoxide reductase catalytic subunit MsrP [Anaerolineaceae bacterium]|nr:protein-methionine-sulfoxide reductase catalytic subunit MsrP [Anaerolineaceae bacterium]
MSIIRSSEITPEHIYVSRRKFMSRASKMALGASVITACAKQSDSTDVSLDVDNTSIGVDELGESWTSYTSITNYNNFYEFSVNKERVAVMAQDLKISPWEIDVGGLVKNPGRYQVENLLTKFDQEERVYRLRCVEGWSMIVPWMGFPLRRLLDEVEPTMNARYVRFETLYDPVQFPGQNDRWYSWPYVEGLRLDEAAHDLTILATGIYGRTLLPQNGAPLRLVVPWKYGFKSIKSIVRIDLVDQQPVSLWMKAAPNEYGFYANVNPNVHHPRWSQDTERRIGEMGRRDTMLFNGYAEQVDSLYSNMDLQYNF